MNLVDPFARPGNWYKGCLHVHSSASDGNLSPDEVLDWYRSRGYDFLALTDHRVTSTSQALDGGFIALAGIELDGVDAASGLYHLVGLAPCRLPTDLHDGNASLQAAVDGLQAAGALVAIAHPYWSGQMSKDLVGVESCFALEVYNGGCEVDDAKGYSTVHWDDLLAAGRPIWGIAVDDAHWRNGSKDAGLGWVWVKAPELTQEAILRSLAEGSFYASCGPKIQQVSVEGSQVRVRSSPVAVIDIVGNGSCSQRFAAASGDALTEVSAWLKWKQRYVRVACRDFAGRWAWSNPIWLDVEL